MIICIYQTPGCQQLQALAPGKWLKRRQWEALEPLQMPLGYPAKAIPDPFLSLHSVHSLEEAKYIFLFPERKILECFVPFITISTWPQGLHPLFLTGSYSENDTFSHISGSPRNKTETISSSLWYRANRLNINGLFLCCIFMKKGWSSVFPSQFLQGAYFQMTKKMTSPTWQWEHSAISTTCHKVYRHHSSENSSCYQGKQLK